MNFNEDSKSDSLLYAQILDFPKQIMFNKDIFINREDSIININLFDYYLKSDNNFNTYLQEGDIINFKNSKKIAVIGEVDNPIRIDNPNGINYKDFLSIANVDVNNLTALKILNYNMINNYSSVEVNRISNIDSDYRSDFDESFLSAKTRSQQGLIYINNKENLIQFLNL